MERETTTALIDKLRRIDCTHADAKKAADRLEALEKVVDAVKDMLDWVDADDMGSNALQRYKCVISAIKEAGL